MPTEYPQVGETVPEPEGAAGEHSFDELSREFASGNLSRGRALKLLGAALLGFGFLGGLFPGVAEAARLRRRRRPRRRPRHRRRRVVVVRPPAAVVPVCLGGQLGCAVSLCVCPVGTRCIGSGSGGFCK